MTRPTADAFGQQLWDIHYHGYPYQVIERSDGLIGVGSGAVYFDEYAAWSAKEQEVVGLASGRVLDIGCGAGRHALHLQQQGCDVLGIDVSPLAVELCRARGLRQAEVLSITDVRRLGARRFDTVLLLGNNLGLFGTPRRGRAILAALAAVTTPTARILGANLDPYRTHDPDHLRYHDHNRERGRSGGQIRMRVRHKALVGPWFDYLFLSLEELTALVRETRWRVTRVIEEGAGYAAVLEKGDVRAPSNGGV